jgi:hypothetical protein
MASAEEGRSACLGRPGCSSHVKGMTPGIHTCMSELSEKHRLLPRANVSRMYAECFDKVLYHVNSRILKCKMTNVITRVFTLIGMEGIVSALRGSSDG